MVRNLYRCYLYIVLLGLLIFFSSALGSFLAALFTLTPLRHLDYEYGDLQKSLAQATIFLIVAAVIVGVLGSLHYWLVRRDIRQDPDAGSGAVRAFFLNLVESGTILLAVGMMGYGVFYNWAVSSYGYDLSWPLASSLASFFLVGLLEWERRRFAVATVTGRVFQRIHYYGVLVIFAIFAMSSWTTNINLLQAQLFHSLGLVSRDDPSLAVPELLGPIWFLGWWVAYAFRIRNDMCIPVRLLYHGWQILCASAFLLTGLWVMVRAIVSPIAGIVLHWEDLLNWGEYAFFASLSLGILLFLGCWFVSSNLVASQQVRLSTYKAINAAIVGALAALFFWTGLATLIYMMLEAGSGIVVINRDWIAAIVLVIVGGVFYIPLSFYLRAQLSHLQINVGPRRAFVLAILASALLAGTISAVILLYNLLNQGFGLSDHQSPQLLHSSIATLIIAALVVGLYIRIALGEELFKKKQQLPVVPAPLSSAVMTQSGTTAQVTQPSQNEMGSHQLQQPTLPEGAQASFQSEAATSIEAASPKQTDATETVDIVEQQVPTPESMVVPDKEAASETQKEDADLLEESETTQTLTDKKFALDESPAIVAHHDPAKQPKVTQVIDELLKGSLTREEAISQLEAMIEGQS